MQPKENGGRKPLARQTSKHHPGVQLAFESFRSIVFNSVKSACLSSVAKTSPLVAVLIGSAVV